MSISGLGVAYSVGGFVLLWSGVKNATMKDTLTSFLKGQQPTPNPTGAPTIGIGDLSGATGTVPAGTPQTGAVPGGGGTPNQNQALAKLMVAMSHPSWGTGQQWQDWVALWNRESGWSQTADTRKTGAGGDNANSAVFAYGIAQARPYSKYPKSGWPPDKGGSSNPGAQISWGIAYIATTYGSPSAAMAHEQSAGWY